MFQDQTLFGNMIMPLQQQTLMQMPMEQLLQVSEHLRLLEEAHKQRTLRPEKKVKLQNAAN
jgi:hypothetical protein